MKRVEDEVDESTENVAVGGNQGVQPCSTISHEAIRVILSLSFQ